MQKYVVAPFVVVIATVLASGCSNPPAASTEPTLTSQEMRPTAGSCGQEGEAEHRHVSGGGCAECDQATRKIRYPDVTTEKTPDGQTVMHAGAPLANAETVTVAALLAAPDAWAGKTVRVAGNVSAMCAHKRAWFAVVGDDQTGTHVRVFTAPNFLVPHDSIGKSAVAEGTVEIIEVPIERARHMAKQHKLGDPEEITAPLKQVLIRATGADFS